MPEFSIRTRTIYGAGCIKELGKSAKEQGAKSVLIVTDPGVRKAGIVDQVEASLREFGVAFTVFDEVSPNPTDTQVDDGVRVAREVKADLICAVGGGSAIDAAKGVAVVLANEGKASDWLFKPGVGGMPTKPIGPFYAVPTTTGTGSEISGAAVITESATHHKLLVLNCTPHMAFLDPELVAGMPAAITAATGMDALTHAVEAYVNPGRTPFTRMFATDAIRSIGQNLREAVNGPDRRKGIEQMQYASNIAGHSMAVGLGQVHGLSHCVSGRRDVPHGVANAILLTAVLSHHREAIGEKIREIGHLMDLNVHGMSTADAAEHTVKAIAQLRKDIGVPGKLGEVGVQTGDIDILVDDAVKSQVIFIHAPVPSNPDMLKAIYQAAL